MGTVISASAAPTNDVVAHTLHWLAVLLEIDGGPSDRIEAYRQAALTVKELDQPVADLVRALGPKALESRGVTAPIAAMLDEWLHTGKLPVVLDSSRRQAGLWPALTRALYGALGIETKPRKKSDLRRPGHGTFHHAVWESWN